MRNGNEGNGKANAREAISENPTVTIFLLPNEGVTILHIPDLITHSYGKAYLILQARLESNRTQAASI
jgi:hypothetical protein